MKVNLNDRIRELRILRGLTQVQFANRLNVSKQCVSNWENDNVLPSIDMLTKIADFFETTTDFLLGRTQENSIETQGLTDIQISHIKALVQDLRIANRTDQE